VTINLQRHEMIEENIDIQTDNGSMNTFVVFPEEDGSTPCRFLFDGCTW